MPPMAPPLAPASGRRLSETMGMYGIAPVSTSGTFMCLEDADGRCAANDPKLTEHLVAEANVRTTMRHMRAVASRWASLPNGEWSRVRM